MQRSTRSFFALGALVASAGCATVIGLDDFEDGATTTTSGQGGSGATGTGGGTTTTTTATDTGGGGSAQGGSGGTGGDGKICEPGAKQKCPYTGAPGTENVGICHAGDRTCNVDGTGYSPCENQVKPEPKDDCATPEDENCDGNINDGCPCLSGSTESCYSGPAGTAGVGICLAGMHTCNADGMGYGPCVGEVLPATETCNNNVDDDCNGQTNEGGAGCACVPNSIASCYTGPGGTQGIGICMAGTKTCNGQGTAYGACVGEVLPQTEVCTQIGDENCDGIACSEPLWTKSFQTGFARFVAVDPNGNVILLGTFGTSLVFGATTLVTAGSQDIYLAKLDPTGQPLWAKRFGDASNQNAVNALAVDASGNITIASTLIGTTDFGGGGLSAGANFGFAVAHFDPAGAHLWSKAFTSTANLYCRGLDVDTTGNVVLAGELYGTANFGAGNLTTAGGSDIFVVKLNSAGTTQWSKRFGDANAQNVNGASVDPSGNIVLLGTHAGTWSFGGPNLTANGTDVYLGRLDAAGNWASSKTIDVGGAPTSVRTDPLGAILITGTYTAAIDLGGGSLPNNGMADIFLAKFTTSCTHVWSKGMGGAGNDWQPTVATDPAGDALLGAQTTGTIDFGGGPLAATGAYDVVMAKFTGAGVHVWSKIFNGSGVDSDMIPAGTPSNQFVVAFSNSSTLNMGLGNVAAGLAVARFQP